MKKVLISFISVLLANISFASNIFYDQLPIMPKTWQEVDLTYVNHLGGKDYLEKVNLLRPRAWVKQYHLDKIGKTVHLTKEQIGQDIDANVVALKPTKLSYSNNDPRNIKPVIATFITHNDDVWDYTFSDGESVQVVSNHPFYSIDRHAFVPIGQIKSRERLQTDNGSIIKLASKSKLNKGVKTVYSFEVYQTHSYRIKKSGIVVHNAPCLPSSVEDIKGKGSFLGGGVYGEAYKVNINLEGDPEWKVFKINKDRRDAIYSAPERTSKLWNEFYSTRYEGRFAHLAAAEVITLEDGTKVLMTPFVDGEQPRRFGSFTKYTSKYRNLKGEFRAIGRKMYDFNHTNIKILRYPENGPEFALPIDFDNVFTVRDGDNASVASKAWRQHLIDRRYYK